MLLPALTPAIKLDVPAVLVDIPVAVSVVNAPVDAEDAPMAVPSIVPAFDVYGARVSTKLNNYYHPLSSVNNRLSATLTASSPCTRSLAEGQHRQLSYSLLQFLVAMFIYL